MRKKESPEKILKDYLKSLNPEEQEKTKKGIESLKRSVEAMFLNRPNIPERRIVLDMSNRLEEEFKGVLIPAEYFHKMVKDAARKYKAQKAEKQSGQ